MAPSSRNKGKDPMHEGASSGPEPKEVTSLLEYVPLQVTFSNGNRTITLHEVLSRNFQFSNGVYTGLPPSIKIVLDNLQRAYTQSNNHLFQRTLKALELHLVNLEAEIEIGRNTTSQLFGKEDIHSKDRMTIMGTDYARLSLKTQTQLRSAVANLPSDIQQRIFRSKAMSESCDLWFKHLQILVITHFPVYDESEDAAFILSTWEKYFGSSQRVYEKQHPFPGLIINYEDWSVEEDPSWLSKMFEYGFVRLIRLTSHDQINQFPQIIRQVVSKIKSPFVSIRCWSTLPHWDKNNWMEIQPAHHLVLINGYTHCSPWYEGDSYLHNEDPKALASCWSGYFNNEIIDVTHELWQNYHFVGNTGRITVFTTRPYSESLHTERIDYIEPGQIVMRQADYEPILFCGICDKFARYHEHNYDYDLPWDPYDGYPSGHDTD